MKDIKEKMKEICEGTPYYVDQVVARYDALIDQLAELFERECEVEALKQEIAELKAEIENYKHALADTIG